MFPSEVSEHVPVSGETWEPHFKKALDLYLEDVLVEKEPGARFRVWTICAGELVRIMQNRPDEFPPVEDSQAITMLLGRYLHKRSLTNIYLVKGQAKSRKGGKLYTNEAGASLRVVEVEKRS